MVRKFKVHVSFLESNVRLHSVAYCFFKIKTLSPVACLSTPRLVMSKQLFRISGDITAVGRSRFRDTALTMHTQRETRTALFLYSYQFLIEITHRSMAGHINYTFLIRRVVIKVDLLSSLDEWSLSCSLSFFKS